MQRFLGLLVLAGLLSAPWQSQAVVTLQREINFDVNYDSTAAGTNCTNSCTYKGSGAPCDDTTKDCSCQLSCACSDLATSGKLTIKPARYYMAAAVDCQLPDRASVSAYGADFYCYHDGVCIDINKDARDDPSVDTADKNKIEWYGGFLKDWRTSSADNDRNSTGIRASGIHNFVLADTWISNFRVGVNPPREAVVIAQNSINNCNTDIYLDDWLDTGAGVSNVIIRDNIIGYSEDTTNRKYLVPGSDDCILVKARTKHITIENNAFACDAQRAIRIYDNGDSEDDGAGSCTPIHVRIHDNHFEGGYPAEDGELIYLLHGASDATHPTGCGFTSPIISGNWFKYPFIRAIKLEWAENPLIQGNVFWQVLDDVGGQDHFSASVVPDSTTKNIRMSQNTFKVATGTYTKSQYPELYRAQFTWEPEVRPLNVTLPSYDLDTFTTTSNVQVDMSSELGANFPAEAPPKGYWLNIYSKNTAAAGYIRIAADGTEIAQADESWELDYKTANQEYWESSIYVPADSNGDIRVKIEPNGGTVTVTIKVKAIQM